MGSSASKGARAAGSTARKYPIRASNPTNTGNAPAQSSRPAPPPPPPRQAGQTKTGAINLDGRDPTFAAQLRSLGAVQPNPHFSPTSTSPLDPQRQSSQSHSSPFSGEQPTPTFAPAYPDPSTNPALTVLSARQRLQDTAETELQSVGRRGFQGREYVDIVAVRQAMLLVQGGKSVSVAEETVGLKKGRLGVLGRGIVEAL